MTDQNQSLKIAVMQPYLFPYIGYFQLIAEVDCFVQYDDVNFRKKSWINRNRILLNQSPHRFALPLSKATQNKYINELDITKTPDPRPKLLDTLKHAYAKTSEFEQVFPMLSDIVMYPATNLADYLDNSIRQICGFIGISSQILKSSEIKLSNPKNKGQDRLIDLVLNLDGRVYVNAPGAREAGLYSHEGFHEHSIELRYLKPGEIVYDQGQEHFEPNLSIIDVLMFNNIEETRSHLQNYVLVK